MGESKRRAAIDAMAHALSKRLADDGNVIGIGAQVALGMLLPTGASDETRDACHDFFMAGAQHLLGAVMSSLDPEHEPTDADLKRMDLIAQELDAWKGGRMEKMREAAKAAADSPDEERRVVFGVGVSRNPAGPPVVVFGIPHGAWEYMRDGKSQTFDLTKAGVPIQLIMFGAPTSKIAADLIKLGAHMNDIDLKDRRNEDFGIKPPRAN